MTSRNRGFTLIELLVVMAIVAVLTSVVTLNISFRNPARVLSDEARRLAILMQLASDQAVYSRQQLGIRFHPQSYEFYLLTPSEEGDPSWQIVDDERLQFRQPSEEIEFQVDIEGIPIVLEDLIEEQQSITEEDPLKPHILFLSNAEIMPDFRVVVQDTEARFRHQIYSGVELPIVVEALE